MDPQNIAEHCDSDHEGTEATRCTDCTGVHPSIHSLEQGASVSWVRGHMKDDVNIPVLKRILFCVVIS